MASFVFFARSAGAGVIFADISVAYLRAASEATHKTPTEIIGELVREKIAQNASA
jgi:hypothetical protein